MGVYYLPRVVGSFCLLVSLFAGLWARADDTTSPAALRQQVGLERLGKVWLLPAEVRLRRDLERLPKLAAQIPLQEKELLRLIEENGRLWRDRQALEIALRQLPSGSPARQQGERQLAEFNQRTLEPKLLGEHPPTRQALVTLAAARHEVLIAAFRSRQTIAELPASYARLALPTGSVRHLLADDPAFRLGPAASYANELKELPHWEEAAWGAAGSWLAGGAPCYREAGEYRVAALVNGAYPVTFTWKTGSEPCFLAWSMAEAAALISANDAPPAMLHVSGVEGPIPARRITVDQLRIGPHVVSQVEFLVLSPDFEFLGAQLSAGALQPHRAQIEPELLRLRVDAPEAKQPPLGPTQGPPAAR